MSSRILSVIAALALIGCQDELILVPGGTPVQAACYHDWTAYLQNPADSGILSRKTDGLLSGPGLTQNVPLFHDCQRLITSGAYSALFAIFATTRVTQLGALASGGVAIPSVEVVALGAYSQLGIAAGYNCVYMFKDAMGNRTARTANRLKNPGDCSQDVSPGTLTGVNLTVVEIPPPQSTDSVPPVARWDSDPAGNYYIGVRCGQVWCEIRGTATGSSLAYFDRLTTTEKSALSPGYRRNYSVKGWYDEQNLATVSATPGAAVPSGIIATAIPSPDINPATDRAFFTDTWRLVAHISLQVPGGSTAPNPYDGKLNLEHTPSPDSPNQLLFCYSTTPEGCFPTSAVPYYPPPVCSNTYNAAVGTMPQGWWARIISSDSPTDVAHKCVLYHPSPGGLASVTPVTARWHWLEQDDIIWEWCPAGCCEVWGS